MQEEMVNILFGNDQKVGPRKLQEDHADVRRVITAGGLEMVVAVVADGIGGENAGERASRLTVETVFASLENAAVRSIPEMLVDALRAANAEVLMEMKTSRVKSDMGCTATVVAIHQSRLYLANVGDSRAYLIRGRKVNQLTMDHTWGNEMLHAGKRTAEELINHPNRDKLTRSIGYHEKPEVDLGIWLSSSLTDIEAIAKQGLLLQPGDRIIVCSDGLFKKRATAAGHFVEEPEMVNLSMLGEPKKAARALTALAVSRQNERDGDNVTAVVLQVPGGKPTSQVTAAVQRFMASKKAVAGLATVLAIAFFAVFAIIVFHDFTGPQTAPTPTIPALSGNFAFVSELRGDATLTTGGSTQPIEFGQQIAASENTILRITGPGRLRLGLADGTLLYLDGDSEVLLLQISGQSFGIHDTLITLNFGRVLVMAHPKPSDRVFILSPLGARGQVIGSIMGATYDPDSQRFGVDCLEGHCAISSQDGQEIGMDAGLHATILGYEAPVSSDAADYDAYGDLGDPGTIPSSTPTLEATSTFTSTPITPSPTRIRYTPRPPTQTPTGLYIPPAPTSTFTPLPTPTNTPIPTPTNTLIPTSTNTSIPSPTNTPMPSPTNTPIPAPTNTPIPAPTDTPVPPPTDPPTEPPTPGG